MILQNGVISNAVPFTIDLPHISGITPNNGSAGTVLTITGVSFGAMQGSGNLWIGSTYGSVIGWSNTQVTASVAVNAVSGIVKIEQNGIWSNAVTFTVPVTSGSGTSVTLVPNQINTLVGSTQSIQALNSSGQSVTGLTWTSSNTAVATLSTDDPPIITAVAAGNTTITAGNASADVTVFTGTTLAPGTVIWSNPGDGSGVISIVPAVPSSTGVADVFALQGDGSVQAITSSGTTAWTAPNVAGSLIPDFQGGLIVADGQSIYRLDGMTGAAYPGYTSPSGNTLSKPVVHTDGTMFTVDGDMVVGINPLTGQQKFNIHMEDSATISSGNGGSNQCTSPLPPGGSQNNLPTVGSLMIAGDGYAYLPYMYNITQSTSTAATSGCGESYASSGTVHLRLMRVGSGGDSSEVALGDWQWAQAGYDYNWGAQSGSSGNAVSATLPSLITNADQGVLASYSLTTGTIGSGGTTTTAYYLATTSGSGVSSNIQMSVPGQTAPVQPILQRQDGNFVGTVGIGPQPGQVTQTNMIAFTTSGAPLLNLSNVTPQIATSDNGVIGSPSPGQYVQFDQFGNVISQLPCQNPVVSWTNNVYQMDPIIQVSCNPPVPSPAAPISPASPRYSNFSGTNPSANSTSAICGNDSDKLVAEYKPNPAYNAIFTPVCTQFTSSSIYSNPNANFSFYILNQDDQPNKYNDYPDYGILLPSLTNGLQNFQQAYGQQLRIDSGYRSPKVNQLVELANGGPVHKDSPHIHGNAADVISTSLTWPGLRTKAKGTAVNACVEPLVVQHNKSDHIHVDWRSPCPSGW